MKTETYTHQQAFDKVAVHLIKQGEKSLIDGGCAYRGCDGKMCAAGVFIPDSIYNSKNMEEQLVTGFWYDYPELYEQFEFDDSLNFVSAMQTIHDDKAVENWSHELIEYAITYELSTDALINALNQPKA